MKKSCTTFLVLAVLGGYAVPAIAQLRGGWSGSGVQL
jgi:hypothetical protein